MSPLVDQSPLEDQSAGRDHGAVERAAELGVGGRAWFAEDDRPGRRLALRPRPGRGQVSLSFWDGAVCRATFHLPEGEIPRLVDELVAALGGAQPPGLEPDTGVETATLQVLPELAE